MGEVKRYTIDFSDGETAEGVLYTDYAAEVADWAKSNKALAVELDTFRTEVNALRDERDSLRAQLKAAKADDPWKAHKERLRHIASQPRPDEKPQLTAQPDGVTVRRIIEWAVARARNRPDTNASIIADEGLDRIYGQALAAPAPVCVCGHAKADHAEKHGWECSEECACLKYTPAPACKTCGGTKVIHDGE